MKRSLIQICEMVEGKLIYGKDEEMIEGVSTDSRKISDGCLFIPLVGEHFNGHNYASEAIAKGAHAILWSAKEGSPPAGVPAIEVEDTLIALQKLAASYRNQLSVRVIGITGSNGKTTTKDMVASILSTTYRVHKTQGNYNNHIGLPLTILEMDEDTEMAVLEMGMSGRGEIELLSRLARPEAALITNIGEAHLMQLGSRFEIAKAKMEILSGLMEDGLFVYPGDEPLVEELFQQMKKGEEHIGFSLSKGIKFLKFGENAENDLYPVSLMTNGKETLFVLNTPSSPTYMIPLLGQHNVTNAIAAIAVCKYMGVLEKDIIQGLKELKLSGMRIERVETDSGLTIFNDCYNASPTSVKASIELLSGLPGFRTKMIVLGDMLELGPQEVEFHREIGSILNPNEIQYVFTYGSLAKYIAEEALKCYAEEQVVHFHTKEELVKHIQKCSNHETVVLVKGSRAMHLEDVVDGLR